MPMQSHAAHSEIIDKSHMTPYTHCHVVAVRELLCELYDGGTSCLQVVGSRSARKGNARSSPLEETYSEMAVSSFIQLQDIDAVCRLESSRGRCERSTITRI